MHNVIIKHNGKEEGIWFYEEYINAFKDIFNPDSEIWNCRNVYGHDMPVLSDVVLVSGGYDGVHADLRFTYENDYVIFLLSCIPADKE